MLTPTLLQRTFLFQDKDKETVNLTDPSIDLSPDEVLDFYSATYPQLITAKVIGPEFEGDKMVFRFESVLGTKG